MQARTYYIIFSIIFITNLLAQETVTKEIKITGGNYNQERTLDILVNKSDKESYQLSKILKPHVSIPIVEVLSNDNLVLIHSLEGIVEFYKSNGLMIKKRKFYIQPPYNEQKLLFAKGKNSNVLLVSENQINTVFLLDNSGNNIDSFTIENGISTGLVHSGNEMYIAVSILKWEGETIQRSSYIFDLANNKTLTIPYQFETGCFDKTGNYFLGYTSKNSFLYDLSHSKVLWKKETAPNEIYLAGILQNENALLIIAGTPALENKEWVYPYYKLVSTKLNGVELEIKHIKTPVRKVSLDKIDDTLYLNIDGIKEVLKNN